MIPERETLENLFLFIIFCGALYFAYDYSSRSAQSGEVSSSPKTKTKSKHIPSKHDFSFFDAPAPAAPNMSPKVSPMIPPAPVTVAPLTSQSVSLIPFLQNDDLCGLSAQLSQKGSRAQQLRDLFEAGGTDDPYGLLTHEPSPLFGTINTQPTSDAARLYNALLAADLLVGVHLAHPDSSALNKADHQLALLSQSRSQNGAYAFFQIATAWRLRHDTSEIQQLIQNAAQGSEFETYSAKMQNLIYQAGLTNPSYFMLATRLTTTLPVPDMNTSIAIINQVNSDHELDIRVYQLGQAMLLEAQQARNPDTQFGSSPLQYLVGLRLIRDGDPTHPVQSYSDLMREKFPADHPETRDSNTLDSSSAILLSIPSQSGSSGSCERQAYDEAFYRLHR